MARWQDRLKEGAVAVAMVVAAEAVMFGISEEVLKFSLAMEMEKAVPFFKAYALFSPVVLLGLYALMMAVWVKAWKPLPEWTFWVLALPWAYRLYLVFYNFVMLISTYMTWGPEHISEDFFWDLVPLAGTLVAAVVIGTMLFEALFKTINRKLRRA